MSAQTFSEAEALDMHLAAADIIAKNGGPDFFEVGDDQAFVRFSHGDKRPVSDYLGELNEFNPDADKLSDDELRELGVHVCYAASQGKIPREYQ